MLLDMMYHMHVTVQRIINERVDRMYQDDLAELRTQLGVLRSQLRAIQSKLARFGGHGHGHGHGHHRENVRTKNIKYREEQKTTRND